MTGIAGVCCLVLVLNFWVHKNTPEKKSTRAVQTTADVLTVSRTALLNRISLTGQTVPAAQVDIAAKYQGKVTGVYAELGQTVTAGQVLVVEDTGDAAIAVLQNQAAYAQMSADAVTSAASFYANYDKAKADYQRALADYQRYQYLYSMGGIARASLDSSEQAMADAKAALDALTNQLNTNAVPAAIESAQAAAAKAQQSVYAAQKQQDDLVLRAPRSGQIGYRQVEVGAMVQAGQKLLSIVDNSGIYVDCQVSEQDLAALALGMNVDVQLESLGRTFPGQIIYISPAADASTQTFSLRIALLTPDDTVRSGMFAKAVINAVLRPNSLVVPKEAVLEKNGQSYVYVVGADNVIAQRVVQVGARGDQTVEILNGISEGEKIAVSNLSRLRNGLAIVAHAVTLDSRGDIQ